MPATKAIVVGSGAGGSIVAMVLAEAGWDVVIFEKGPNYYTNLAGTGPFPTLHSNDELKSIARYFEQPDPIAFPRTFRLALLDKDVGIAAQVAREGRVPSPLLQLTSELFGFARGALGEDADHVEAVRLIEQWAGVELG